MPDQPPEHPLHLAPHLAPLPMPSWRKPVGAIGLIVLALGWTMAVATGSTYISMLHPIAQALFYLIAGTVWIFPAMPLLRWMEIGQWRK